ncbi:histone H1, early embryonic [Drosophila mojavensis]|uniref:H15 domain-containing protein n=1 Tax=Drosophila mojavensis TaxID=7230 RepID=B4K7G8_DROMO|nr:histone H1, early embryonic [Drosophila mojavensis]EDW15312.1 uncharacterized protein Dmoj_GI24753 [Drosophila mojavensis]
MAEPEEVKSTPEVKVANKGSILSHCLKAIKALNSRSGSSVPAIVNFIKSSGYEVTDMARMKKLVARALKVAMGTGDVVQVKRSFKMSATAKAESKAMEKMKANQQKKLDKAKAKEQKVKTRTKPATKKDSEKTPDSTGAETAKPKQRRKKPSERHTNEPAKKKSTAKIAAVGGKIKPELAAGESDQTTPKKPKKAQPKAKPASAKTKALDNEVSAASKLKTPRKSIGSLTKKVNRPKIQNKSIKKLVAGRKSFDDPESDLTDSGPAEASTPLSPTKQKRMAKQIK